MTKCFTDPEWAFKPVEPPKKYSAEAAQATQARDAAKQRKRSEYFYNYFGDKPRKAKKQEPPKPLHITFPCTTFNVHTITVWPSQKVTFHNHKLKDLKKDTIIFYEM